MQTIEKWIALNDVLTFYLLLAFSFLINRLPVAGVFFRTVNTLLHETGHALGAIITSGEVVRIELKEDTSGIAETKSRGKWRAFLVSFAGYPFAALSGTTLLILAMTGSHKIAAFILMTVALINLMFFVRNWYGIIWLIIFLALLISTTVYASDIMLKVTVVFICLIAVTEAFASTLTITLLSFSKPARAGDLTNLQKTSGIPAGFWALVIFGTVMVIIYYTITNYFPGIGPILADWKLQ